MPMSQLRQYLFFALPYHTFAHLLPSLNGHIDPSSSHLAELPGKCPEDMQAFKLPEGAWDSHTHAIDPDHFALDPNRDYTPKEASKYQAADFRTSLGIEHTIIVQPSVYGLDNSCLLDALAFFEGRATGVCVIDPASVTPELLKVYHAAGIRGIRVNFGNGGTEDAITAAVRANAAVAKSMGWVLQLYIPEAAWMYLHRVIPQLGVVVVADHFGHVLVGSQTGNKDDTEDPFRRPGFKELIDLVERGLLYVKLSAPYQDSNDGPRYGDMRTVAETIIRAGPDRVVYGSDWPHTSSKSGNPNGNRLAPQDYRNVSDVAIVETIESFCGSEEQKRKLFIDNPRRLWLGHE